MSGFSNAVVGGVGKLIRKWIQSPDYVPGTSGWTVNQDGTVEFNDGTFRGTIEASKIILIGPSGEILVYSGTPAAGNLILAISGVAGVDPYGNPYSVGVTLAATPNGPFGIPISQIQFYSPYRNTHQSAIWDQGDAGNTGGGGINIFGPAPDGQTPPEISAIWNTGAGISQIVLQASSGEVSISGDMKFGAGYSGKYHYEEWDISPLSGYSIANSVLTAINGAANLNNNVVRSGYGGTKFDPTTGRFTAPVTGIFRIDCTIGFLTWGSGRYLMRIRLNGTTIVAAVDCNPVASGNVVEHCSAELLMVGNTDYLEILIFQSTGATRTIENDLGVRSFFTIRRVL